MCGICGIISKKEKVNQDLLERMTMALSHRGPDARGLWMNGKVGLGHQRLAVIDLNGGSQPMTSADQRYHLVFNGEIYNFKEIAKELEKDGLIAKTLSDTEILLLAYCKWGADCLQHLVGMFAFAVWDEHEQTLFLARDRLGKKPLHYYEDGEFFAFASEIKGLLAHPQVKRHLDLDSLSKYLAYDYTPAPRSILKNIHKLMPGTFAYWRKGRLEIQTYWQPQNHKKIQASEEEILDTIEAKLHQAVQTRLVSDVPLGVFLSGGIDSSMIVALMSESAGAQKIKTFTIGFEEATFDERAHARQVADFYATEHHEEVLSAKKALELVPQVSAFMDEPMADPSIIPTYMLSKFTRQHVTVALGGDGGDELFVGYENYRASRFASYYLKIPKLLRRYALENIIKKLSPSEANLPLDYKMQRFVRGIDFPAPIRNYAWLGSLTPSEQTEIFRDEINRQRQKKTLEEIYEEAFETEPPETGQKGHDHLEGLLALDLRLYLQDDILVKVDRASMANSLEVRSPFLDHRLVEYLLSLPLESKFPGYGLKYLLKKIARKKLPRKIVQRRKQGFGIPVTRWIKKDLAELFDQYLSAYRLRQAGIFKPEVVTRLLAEHRSGHKDHRKALWALLIFEMWRETYQPQL